MCWCSRVQGCSNTVWCPLTLLKRKNTGCEAQHWQSQRLLLACRLSSTGFRCSHIDYRTLSLCCHMHCFVPTLFTRPIHTILTVCITAHHSSRAVKISEVSVSFSWQSFFCNLAHACLLIRHVWVNNTEGVQTAKWRIWHPCSVSAFLLCSLWCFIFCV